MSAITLPIIASVAGGIKDLFGFGENPQEWIQNALVALYERAQLGDEQARQMFWQFAEPLQNATRDPLNYLGQNVLNYADPMMQRGENLLGGQGDLYDQAGYRYITPEMQSAQGGLDNLSQHLGGLSKTAGDVFYGGGWTPQYQQAFDTISPFMQGQNPAQQALLASGMGLLGAGGQTGYTQGMQGFAGQQAARGGMTPQLLAGQQAALGTIGTGGYTPGIDAVRQAGLGILQSGGATQRGIAGQDVALKELTNRGLDPISAALQMRGVDLAGRESLLSPEQAANFAREGVSDSMVGQMENLYRDALARGGGPQSQTFSGQTNQMLADVGDRAARAEAQAVQQAMVQQQGLGLQQAGLGGQLAGTGGDIAGRYFGQAADMLPSLENAMSQRLGVGGSIAGDAERAAAQRFGTGFGALGDLQGAGTQALAAYLSAGGQAGSLEAQRLGLGGQLAQGYSGDVRDWGSLWNNTMGNQNQYALGAGTLAGNLGQNMGNVYNMMYNNPLAATQLGVQAAGSQAGAQNSAYGNWGDMYGRVAGAWNSTMQPYSQLAQAGLAYGAPFANLMGRPFANLQWSGNTGATGSGVAQGIGTLFPEKP